MAGVAPVLHTPVSHSSPLGGNGMNIPLIRAMLILFLLYYPWVASTYIHILKKLEGYT